MSKYTNKKLKRLGLEKPESRPLVKTIIVLTSITSAALLGLAAPALLDSTTSLDYIKVGLLTLGAGVVTFGVNTIAIERAAPLAAVGSKVAGLAGVLAISLVGTGLFTSTYAGLVRYEVSEMRLQEFGNNLTGYVNTIHEQALESGQIIPVIRANVSDREQKLACEILASCISEHKSAGDGPVAKLLRGQVGRANTIASELENGQAELAAILRVANNKLGQYRKILSDRSRAINDRKISLQQIAAEILQSTAQIKEASPQGLLRAYLSEIDASINVQGKPIATRNINALSRKYADNLRSVLTKSQDDGISRPEFPAKTGVAETLSWKWLSHFFPIALFVGVLELVWPLLIFLITLLVLSYNVKRADPPAPKPQQPGPFDILFEDTPSSDDDHDDEQPPESSMNNSGNYRPRRPRSGNTRSRGK